MRISELAVKNPQFTLIAFVLLGALGVTSFLRIPRSEDPYFPTPNFGIVAVYPGATPGEVEQQVVDPIEDAIGELSEVKDVKTRIGNGVAVLIVEFEAGVDGDRKHDELLREVGAIRGELPEGLFSLDIDRFTTTNVKVLQLALVSETATAAALEEQADALERRLGSVAGVKEAESFAVPAQTVRIDLDTDRLARLGIPYGQIIAAVRGGNASIPGGSIAAGSRTLSVETTGPYEDLDELRQTIVGGAQGDSRGFAERGGVAERSTFNAQLVRLQDVATVTKVAAEPTYLGRYDGKRAAFVTVTVREGQNIFVVTDALKERIADFRTTLPAGISVELGFDQSQNVAHRLGGLQRDFLIAILLVLVTLIPLGLRASLVVLISIPMSLAIGITILDLAGYSLNQLSIVGFVLALGLLVDDSIVVAENITRWLRLGYSREEAAIRATKQIGVAVLGCTATLVLAFVPLLFLPGNAGSFIRSMPFAVVATIGASLLVSLTLIPFLASRVLRGEDHDGNWAFRLFSRVVEGAYRPILNLAMNHRKTTLVVGAALFAASLALVPRIGFSLFPKAGTPQFLVRIHTPEGTNLEKTDEAARFVEEKLRAHPEVTGVLTNVGKGNPQIYYNVGPAAESPHVAELFVQLDAYHPSRTPALLDELRAEVDAVPGAEIEVKEFENGPPIDAPVAIRLFGDDLGELERLAAEVETLLRETPGTRDVRNPLGQKRTDLRLVVDEAKAGLLGIPAVEIDRAVRLAINGLDAGTFREPDGDEVGMLVTVPHAGLRPTPAVLEQVYLPSQTGAQIPLAQVARVELSTSPNLIQHHDRQRAVVVSANVETGANTARVTDAVIARLAEKEWPSGYRWEAAGEVESRKESFGGLGPAVLIAIFGVLAVLVLEFGTFRATLIVASVIPLGVVGGLVALSLTGHTLSFTATIGFIALTGIEVKNSILLVDFTNQLRAEGVPVAEAVRRAGETRFFPILLTSLTAIGGLLPLALEGSALYSPLAWVLIGGLVSSTLLSRLVTPVLSVLLLPSTHPAASHAAPEPLTPLAPLS
jgi:multidrug efflux pump subunit AcrB